MTVRTALTLGELGSAMARVSDDAVRLRMVLDFIDGCAAVDPADRAELIRDEPATFDERWDALLASLADTVAYDAQLDQAPWAEGSARFLSWFWFPVNLPSVIPEAIASSPATFMRHGVLVTPDLFSRA